MDLREADLARLSGGTNRNNKRALDESERLKSQPSSNSARHNPSIQPSRLVTNFVVPSNETSSRGHTGNGAGPLPAMYQQLAQAAPRPYNLGLDYAGQSPSTPFNPSLYHAQRSLFPQFERWFTADPQGGDYQSQAGAYTNGTQMDASMDVSSQMPRLPVSSARLPSYWNEYDEPSMMSSSLYNLPILHGGNQPVNMQSTAQPLYPEADYSGFT